MPIPRALTPNMPRFDPVKLAHEVERIVCRDIQGEPARKYLRSRIARFYKKCVTLDVIGCNLRCFFCWASPAREYPEEYGKFKLPISVLREAESLARRHKVRRVRLSGGEPTIGKDHLLRLLELVEDSRYIDQIILETNGILIGAEPEYARNLSRYSKLIVRVSIKAGEPKAFSRRTGAIEEAFELPLIAIERLLDSGVHVYVALMTDPRIVDVDERKKMFEMLAAIDPSLPKEVEEECIEPYPLCIRRMQLAGIRL
ncbi:MAG: molybdenum cofactor biosynthesis protein MoaA [Thermoprotei archaeon]|nr:MAG: molybdenum cofactor biosynthesis protein MoaA [Thermoprotei archaeon]